MIEINLKKYTSFEEHLKDSYKLVNAVANYYLEFISTKSIEKKSEIKNKASGLFKEKNKIIENNLNSGKVFISAKEIKTKYSIDSLSWMAIILAIMSKLSKKFESLILSLDKSGLTYELFFKLCEFIADNPEKDNLSKQFQELKAKLKSLGFKEDSLEISDLLLEIITKNLDKDIKIKGINIYFPEDKCAEDSPLPIRENKAQEIKNFILKNNFKNTLYFELQGQDGIGKRTTVKRISKLLNKKLVIINFKKLIRRYKESWYEIFKKTICENGNQDTILCLQNFDIFFDQEFECGEDYAEKVISLSENHFRTVFVLLCVKPDMSEYQKKLYWFSIPIDEIDDSENLKLWQVYMSDIKKITDITPEDMANRFNFIPAQIKNAVTKAKKDYLWKNNEKLNKEDLCKCAYSQVINTLGEKARLITKKYTWDDIIIDSDTKLSLKRACERIKYKHTVYNKWGMENRVLYGKGLSMMFYGVSGTGKTMAAQVIASELGLELYKVDIARVVSKYIGETEKNLKEIFDEAKKSSVILLFDEADSLFSKRTEVKDAHDRNANIETAFLLQQIEDYDGITILTTNRDGNIDDAFKRRITFKINFSNIHPGVKGSEKYEEKLKLREELWSRFFKNGKMPLDNDIDFKYLAEEFTISGAEIRNIALTAAFLAAAQSSKKIGFRHILSAMKNVLNIQDSEFGSKYSYMLKDCN